MLTAEVSVCLLSLQDLENTKVRVLFLSEGNVCRSVYAEAIFNSLIGEHGMQEFVECASKVWFRDSQSKFSLPVHAWSYF